MAGVSYPDAAIARRLRHQTLMCIHNSIVSLVIILRDSALQREQSLEQERVLQQDCAARLEANLHEEIDLLGRRPLTKELEQLQGLLRGTEKLRAAMERRRAEIQREVVQVRAYISALYTAGSLTTGFDPRSETGMESDGALSR